MSATDAPSEQHAEIDAAVAARGNEVAEDLDVDLEIASMGDDESPFAGVTCPFCGAEDTLDVSQGCCTACSKEVRLLSSGYLDDGFVQNDEDDITEGGSESEEEEEECESTGSGSDSDSTETYDTDSAADDSDEDAEYVPRQLKKRRVVHDGFTNV